MANGENNPAPIPATALDINRIVKVGASAVILFAIVKMNIEYNNIFFNGFPARREANTGADIAYNNVNMLTDNPTCDIFLLYVLLISGIKPATIYASKPKANIP